MLVRALLTFGLIAVALQAQEDHIVLPMVVEACLENQAIRGQVTVSTHANPYYLRGDFDGDGRFDYAVAVKGGKSGKLRVLVCTATGRTTVLGQEGTGQAFSDMPDDNFFAPTWMVYTRAEVKELTKFTSNAPPPIPALRGEAIAMIWEDGISLIYWNGATFRWAGSKQ